MEMEIAITIKGTTQQVGNLLGDSEFFKKIIDSGQITSDQNGDNSGLLEVFDDVYWDTILLAHLIFVHGKHKEGIGIYLTQEELLEEYSLDEDGKIFFKSDQALTAKLDGAKKISQRYGMPEILKTRIVLNDDEKRYYLTEPAIPVLQQYIELNNDAYREWLDGKGYSYPGE